MESLNVRRLAAVDMHGLAGTPRRRRLIRAEFIAGALGGLGLGVWVAATADSTFSRVFGAWTAGAGVSYAALAWQAESLSRPGALDAGPALPERPHGCPWPARA
jgi:hypothetical protein